MEVGIYNRANIKLCTVLCLFYFLFYFFIFIISSCLSDTYTHTGPPGGGGYCGDSSLFFFSYHQSCVSLTNTQTQGHRVAEDIVGVLARMERVRELQVFFRIFFLCLCLSSLRQCVWKEFVMCVRVCHTHTHTHRTYA